MKRRLLMSVLAGVVACGGESGGDGAAATPEHPSRFELGRPADPTHIAAIDIDVAPGGAGLPAGSGTHAQGAAIYAQKCASCHGAKGEGNAPIPRVIGRDPREGFPFGTDPKLPKTVGNYWPYATTVFDYVRRTMPPTAPGSLQPAEVYSLVAWLLAENEIIGKDSVMSAETLAQVKMPARDKFVKDDRQGGKVLK
jgi:mono/diheme cytochrome c family protein